MSDVSAGAISPAPGGEAAAKLKEWSLSLNPKMPYLLDKMFPKLSGWGAKGEAKRKVKLIANVEPLLSRMLQQGEEILYVAKGVQYKFSEHYFMGIWAAMINQTVFVLTNVRLIMLRTDTHGKPKSTYWMIYYSQIDKFKGSWTGTVNVKLRDSTKLTFTGFSGTDRKSMPAIFEEILEKYRAHGFDPEVSQSRENICTHCLVRVPKDEYNCGKCQAEYWTPSEVALRSLMFPSWGDFVMGHTAFACVELFGYAVLWLFIVIIFAGALSEGPEAVFGAAIFAAVALAFSHLPDAALTYYIAKKGLHPKTGPQPRAETPLA